MVQITVVSKTKPKIILGDLDLSSTFSNIIKLSESQANSKITRILYKGRVISPEHTLRDAGITGDDVVDAEFASEFEAVNSLGDIPPGIYLDPTRFVRCVESKSVLLDQLFEKSPLLAEAVLAHDYDLLRDMLANLRHASAARIGADGGGSVAQQRDIEHQIRQQNIDQNLSNALEFAPEHFAMVHMLYVPVEVNGQKAKAFVDSGSQVTLVSRRVSDQLGLARLVDKRFSGVASGVGKASIIGRIHIAQIKIGKACLNCSFNVLEEMKMDILLGLDMLKRHLMVIDFRNNVLRVHSEAIPFLSEREITSTQTLSNDQYGEHLRSLRALGFSQKSAEEALEKCSGNLEEAVLLLSKDK